VNEINFPSVYPQISLKRLKRFLGGREEKTFVGPGFGGLLSVFGGALPDGRFSIR
jgi:hypothetical protein